MTFIGHTLNCLYNRRPEVNKCGIPIIGKTHNVNWVLPGLVYSQEQTGCAT